jgi:hypothetical protein
MDPRPSDSGRRDVVQAVVTVVENTPILFRSVSQIQVALGPVSADVENP